MKKFFTNSFFINGGAMLIAITCIVYTYVDVSPVKAGVFNEDCQAIWDYSCQCGQPCPPPKGPRLGGLNCPCKETDGVSGKVITGLCTAPGICAAKNAPGEGGGNSLGDIKNAVDIAKSVMDMLKSAQGGGGGGSGSGGSGGSTGSGGTYCSDGSYQPSGSCPVSTALNTTGNSNPTGTSMSDLLNAIGGGTSGSIPTAPTDTTSGSTGNTVSNTDTLGSTGDNTSQVSVTGSKTGTTPAKTTTGAKAPAEIAGIKGDMVVKNTGVTMFVSNIDSKANKTLSGFYGVNIASGQTPTALVSRLCAVRPWASNFLNTIAPPLFFDALCTYRGYAVGTPKVTVVNKPYTPPAKKATSVATSSPATTTPAKPVSNVAPKVQVWATPATVPLDTRTSVFWNTQGVSDCMVTSPDGSFTQNSLSGGASTVPLTADTTFTISCIAPDGTPVTGYTTVHISL